MAGPMGIPATAGRDSEQRPSYVSLLAKPDWSSPAGQAWLVTFTDLVALMLAFFVLLFAMSQIEQRKWEGLVESLASDFNVLHRLEVTKPAVEYQPEETAVVPGADLDYLAPVIRQQVAADPLLSGASVRHTRRRLVISLPAGSLYRSGGATLTAKAQDIGFALGGVLRNLSNRIEVEAHLARSGPAPVGRREWELTLARAAAFTGILTRAGYRGPILARGKADPGSDPDAATRTDGRLDVVIHELAKEPK